MQHTWTSSKKAALALLSPKRPHLQTNTLSSAFAESQRALSFFFFVMFSRTIRTIIHGQSQFDLLRCLIWNALDAKLLQSASARCTAWALVKQQRGQRQMVERMWLAALVDFISRLSHRLPVAAVAVNLLTPALATERRLDLEAVSASLSSMRIVVTSFSNLWTITI
jgi:hypothetical protein